MSEPGVCVLSFGCNYICDPIAEQFSEKFLGSMQVIWDLPEGNMTVFKPRSRMISIRLSDEEYSGLKRLCVVKGARSVSDLARSAMSDLLAGGVEGRLGSRVEEVRMQITALDRKLDEISARLSSPAIRVD